MNSILFYLSFGGAALILIYGGIQIMRKYPRLKQPPEPRGFIEAEWVQITKQNEEWCGRELERERIQKQEVCSDKSHWHLSNR